MAAIISKMPVRTAQAAIKASNTTAVIPGHKKVTTPMATPAKPSISVHHHSSV